MARELTSPPQRGQRLAEALLHARTIEAPAVRDAVAAVLADRNEFGMLDGFVKRFRTSESEAEDRIRIRIVVRQAGSTLPFASEPSCDREAFSYAALE